MKRRIVRQAGQAHTITLPIEWIRSHGLKAGDEIEVTTSDNSITITTERKKVGGKASFNLRNYPKRTHYLALNSAYAKGFEEIEIETNLDLQKDTQSNVGMAIIEQKNYKYRIKDISGTTTTDLDELFKRVFQMILSFSERVANEIYEHKASFEELKQIDREINKFILFLQRSIIKHTYPDSTAGKILFAFSYGLEVMSDHLARAWILSNENKAKKNEKIQKLYSLAHQALLKSFEIRYQFSFSHIEELNALKQKIRKEAEKIFTKDPIDSQLINYTIRLAEDASDLSHLSIMLKIE